MPPNILFIITDQQRHDTIGALGNGIIRTPTLDRLAREGMAFTHAYTPSPVCMAARSALITGLPPHVTGCTDNVPLAQEQTSFMQRLQAVGYQTHGVGKMHFGPDPLALWGFDSRNVSEELGGEGDDYRAFVHANGFEHVTALHGVRSEYYYIPQPSQLPARLHNTAWTADRSIDFLQQRDRERPFCLWTSFIKPHPPFENPTPWNWLYRAAEMAPPFRPQGYEALLSYWNRVQNRYKYRDAGLDDLLIRTMRAAYYACISFIDYQIGRILDALGDDIDDTLVIFTSDHGEMLGDYGSFGKRTMLDPSVRVPLLARLPGSFSGNTRVSTPVTLLDLFPTFLGMARLEGDHPHAEGTDLTKLGQFSDRKRMIFSQFSSGPLGLYMATDGRYKYIWSAADEREWFFDRNADPRETHSFAGNPAYAPHVEQLRNALLARHADDKRAVQNGAWRRWGTSAVPAEPDLGLLYQDPSDVQGQIDALGPYARTVTVPPEEADRLVMNNETVE